MPWSSCHLPQLSFTPSSLDPAGVYCSTSGDAGVSALPLAQVSICRNDNGQRNFANTLLYCALGEASLNNRMVHLRDTLLRAATVNRHEIQSSLIDINADLELLTRRLHDTVNISDEDKLSVSRLLNRSKEALSRLLNITKIQPMTYDTVQATMINARPTTPPFQVTVGNHLTPPSNDNVTLQQINAEGAPLFYGDAPQDVCVTFKPFVKLDQRMSSFGSAQQMNWLNWGLMHHLGGEQTVEILVADATKLAVDASQDIAVNATELAQSIFSLITNIQLILIAGDIFASMHGHFSHLCSLRGVNVDRIDAGAGAAVLQG